MSTQGFLDDDYRMTHKRPSLVLSGGQTGVDRAALDWAIFMNISHAGWCPRGRTAQDGQLPERYLLKETASSGYSQRTRMNVRDADATLIIHHGQLQGGTLLTCRYVNELHKPLQIVDLSKDLQPQIKLTKDWWLELNLSSLNVAGPSEGRALGVYDQTLKFLAMLWPANC